MKFVLALLADGGIFKRAHVSASSFWLRHLGGQGGGVVADRRGKPPFQGTRDMTSETLRKIFVAGAAVAALSLTAACHKSDEAASAASDAASADAAASTAASDAAVAASAADAASAAASDAAMSASAAAPANQ